MTKSCLRCGAPSPSSYCPEHTPKTWNHREGSSRSRGYSTSWDKLSRRARRLQPFCTDCGATDDLQLDHTPRTWELIDAGKTPRLKDTGGVVCGPCNRRRGSGRNRVEPSAIGSLAAAQTHGDDPSDAPQGPRGKADSQLQSELPSAPYAPKAV